MDVRYYKRWRNRVSSRKLSAFNSAKDNQKPNEGDAGQFKSEELKWQPQMCGRYTAKIKAIDAVQRESNEKTVDFTIMVTVVQK